VSAGLLFNKTCNRQVESVIEVVVVVLYGIVNVNVVILVSMFKISNTPIEVYTTVSVLFAIKDTMPSLVGETGWKIKGILVFVSLDSLNIVAGGIY
jgi:hypothetical protein